MDPPTYGRNKEFRMGETDQTPPPMSQCSEKKTNIFDIKIFKYIHKSMITIDTAQQSNMSGQGSFSSQCFEKCCCDSRFTSDNGADHSGATHIKRSYFSCLHSFTALPEKHCTKQIIPSKQITPEEAWLAPGGRKES